MVEKIANQEPKTEGRSEQRPALVVGLTHKVQYGGPRFLRAISRIAINHLAAVYPDLARMDSVRPMKEYVLGRRRGSQPLAWHSFATLRTLRIPKTDRFSHWVCITKRADLHRLQAAVVMFETLCVAVELGRYDGDKSETTVFRIDPLAELPDDMRRSTKAGVPAPIVAEQPTTKFAVIRALTFLARRIDSWLWLKTAPELVVRYNALRAMPAASRTPRIAELLEAERQHLLYVLEATVFSIPNIFCWGKERVEERRRLRRLIAARRARQFELAPWTLRLVETLRQRIAEEISRKLIYRPLNAGDLWLLLNGLGGVELAIPILLRAAKLPVRHRTVAQLMRGMVAAWSMDGDRAWF